MKEGLENCTLDRGFVSKAKRLDPLSPQVTPALSGEGVWLTQEATPAPYNYLPLDAKTFIRPDPSHPYAIVTLLQFDTRFSRLHMVADTIEPGGPRGFNGPGVIPIRDQQANALLAAFNGGFKYADGQYGLMVNNTIYVPPQPRAATIAVTREGQTTGWVSLTNNCFMLSSYPVSLPLIWAKIRHISTTINHLIVLGCEILTPMNTPSMNTTIMISKVTRTIIAIACGSIGASSSGSYIQNTF